MHFFIRNLISINSNFQNNSFHCALSNSQCIFFFRSMLSAEESQDRFEDADADEDGRITWNEILQDMYGSDPDDLELDDQLIQDDKVSFEWADTNKDNFLDREEFKAYTHPEETPRMFPLLLKQALDEKDKDNDSFISFQVTFIGKFYTCSRNISTANQEFVPNYRNFWATKPRTKTKDGS